MSNARNLADLLARNVTGTMTPIVTLTATGNITAATHAGKTLLMGEVGGNAAATFTLPAATGSGAEYRFIVSVVNTSNYKIQVANANDIMTGSATMVDSDTSDNMEGFVTAAASDTITLNGSTTGGVTHATITCTAISSTKWSVSVVTAGTGNLATPFSAAVS